MDMLEKIESTQLCPDCDTIRTSRSRHCSVCGHCVERFDHHCPWINNCVGIRNHNLFYFYIVFQTLLVTVTIGESCMALFRFFTQQGQYRNEIFGFDDVIPSGLLESKIFYLCWLALLLGITIFFIAPLYLLLWVHSKNFISGKTTMERFGRVGNENDKETRIMNSGITNDTQIYRHSISRVGSFVA